MTRSTHINIIRTWIIESPVSPLRGVYCLRGKLFVVKKGEGWSNLELSVVFFFFFYNGRRLQNRERGVEYLKPKSLKASKKERYAVQALWCLWDKHTGALKGNKQSRWTMWKQPTETGELLKNCPINKSLISSVVWHWRQNNWLPYSIFKLLAGFVWWCTATVLLPACWSECNLQRDATNWEDCEHRQALGSASRGRCDYNFQLAVTAPSF